MAKRQSSTEYSFAKALNEALNEIQERTFEETERIVDEVAAEAVEKLHGAYPRGGGDYNKGWASKVSKATKNTNVYTRTIYGKAPTFRLAHLLEHGHAKRNGDRVDGYQHIVPIEEAAIAKIIARLKEEL